MRRASLILFFGVLLSTPLFADDLNPPPWLRGDVGTTYERWEFSNAANPAAPGIYYNPNGQPLASILGGGTWSLFSDGRFGVWDVSVSATMTLDVPNYPPPNQRKEVWLQLTWESPGGVPPSVLVNGTPGSIIEDDLVGPGGFAWHHTTYGLTLYPNPPSEVVQIFGPAKIDEVVLDTWCIPEPRTWGLVVLGCGCLAVRQWRRRGE